MWQNIKEGADFTKMKVKGILLQYSGSNSPLYPIPNKDASYKTYQIEAIRMDELDIQGTPAYVIPIAVIKMGVRHKKMQDMISEKNWWYIPSK